MKALFADTFYYLALVSKDDKDHARAIAHSQTWRGPVVTTAWVVTEVADALAAPRQRAVFAALWDAMLADKSLTIVPPSEQLFELGLHLYLGRNDKGWSLTDCISFVVMEQEGLTEALTGDRHFEQAGFSALLR